MKNRAAFPVGNLKVDDGGDGIELSEVASHSGFANRSCAFELEGSYSLNGASEILDSHCGNEIEHSELGEPISESRFAPSPNI